jgi:hypothetical protein
MQAANTSHESTSERIAEIGKILALGLMRLHARKSSDLYANSGEVSLDCVGGQSGHAISEVEKVGR